MIFLTYTHDMPSICPIHAKVVPDLTKSRKHWWLSESPTWIQKMLAHLKSYFFTHAKKNHKNFKGNQYISLDFSNYDLPIQCLISNIALRDWVLVVSIIGRLNFYKRKFHIPGDNLSSCSTIFSELVKLPKLVSRLVLSLKDFATWWIGEDQAAATALDMLIIHSPHICWKRIKAFCRILTNKVRISWTCFFYNKGSHSWTSSAVLP